MGCILNNTIINTEFGTLYIELMCTQKSLKSMSQRRIQARVA